MKNTRKCGVVISLIMAASMLLTGCGGSKLNTDPGSTGSITAKGSTISGSTVSKQTGTAQTGTSSTGTTATGTPTDQAGTVKPIDLATVKPNESGKIMVVMFHNFIASYQKGDKDYTTTFDNFRTLLDQLYNSGYRLINLNDFLDNNINVKAGCIPMVFTFDDGTAGQFNLVDQDGKLKANPDSAVGIMEEFNRQHPDFGLKGTFYINLGMANTFGKTGTLDERLKYLVSEGFELGNHTYDHINLKKAKSADEVQMEIGKNQDTIGKLVPGYVFKTFSLPFGLPSKTLRQYVISGQYDSISYQNHALMEVGWDPSVSPADPKFDPMSIHRVRATGIVPVNSDLSWWLKNLSRDKQYISDGNPDTVTVPKASEKSVDTSKLNGRKLIVY